METVQLQCGHCKKVMAIGVDYLGGQVQCPHCKGVVQTPPRKPPAPPPPPIPNMELNQRESIFAGAEASDAVLGETPVPQVELPPAANHAPMDEPSVPDEPDVELTKFKSRPVYDKSVASLIALIFLVPYAILTTMFILYLLFVQGTRTHPFDMMPDSVPDQKKGGPKHVMIVDPKAHALASHQITTFGKPIRVGKDGDLIVTPERVRLTEDGDLQLFLRAKNDSKDTAFDPINEFYVRFSPNKNKSNTCLLSKSNSSGLVPIYGAYLEYRKAGQGKDAAATSSALLAPKSETIIVLTTQVEYQKTEIPLVLKSNDTFVWRVQLRRGFVKWRGKEVSATAIIGVEFTSAQIERDKQLDDVASGIGGLAS